MRAHVFLVLLSLGSSSLSNLVGVKASSASSSVITNQVARDCGELQSTTPDVLLGGVYFIQPLGFPSPFLVYCDFETDGGGWTVFQRRLDGSVDFHREWNDYRNGFGDLRTEFWLGNEQISAITSQKNYQLRIELTGILETPRYAKYSAFRLGREDTYYKLFLGTYSGDAGSDALDYHRNKPFSTHDSDNDESSSNCASLHKGGWWFRDCDHSNLNADWTTTGGNSAIEWTGHPGGAFGLRFTEMKIIPRA